MNAPHDHTDHVATVLEQWARERPDVDVTPMGVIGRLSRVARRIDDRLARNFALHGIDAATFDVLATLRRSGVPYTLSPKALRDSSMVTSSAIAQRLNKVEADGLVRRTLSQSDGRGKEVQLTEKGRKIIDDLLPHHAAEEHAILETLTPDQQTTLAGLLARLDE